MSDEQNPQAREMLHRVGMRLRAAREARNLTVQEVSSHTRINPTFIAKIEEGDLDSLPGLTFVRGFIRNYLQVLELDDEDIEADLAKIGGMDEYISQTSLGPKITEIHGDSDRISLPFQKTVIIAVAGLLVIWAGYMLYRVFSRAPAPPEVAVTETVAAPEQPAGPQPEAAQPAPAEPEAPAAAAAEKAPPGTPEPPAADGTPPPKEAQPAPGTAAAAHPGPLEAPQNLRLTVRGLEPTWLRLSVDRAPPIEVRVEPADTLNWEADEEIRLVIGKSHGVAVYLNGEDILLPAERNRLIPSIVLNKLTLLRLEN